MRRLAPALLLAAACGAPAATPVDAPPGGDGAPGDGAPSPDAGDGRARIRVHFPGGGHAVTLRGSGGGLSWTAGAAGATTGDVHAFTTEPLAAAVEFKPLLDDTTWARGPNYRVAPGATVDVWPRFAQAAGQVVTLEAAFHSAALGNDRPIYAYLPPSYDENPGARYPVVYMHDGQNLWAARPELATFGVPWAVDAAMDAAAEQGACASPTVHGWGAQPLGGAPVTCTGDGDCGPGGRCETFPEAIVIGVGNTAGRLYEYTPTADPMYAPSGGGDRYLALLVDELKPMIDARLRTRPEAASTVLMGSSLGGLITAYAGRQRPDVFGRLGELSPSTWWDNLGIVATVQGTPAGARPAVVYVDSGGDADGKADTDLLAQAYLGLGFVEGDRFRHVVQPGAAHSEAYWAQRTPGALQLLLGVR